MNRTEFMRQLERLLQNIPEAERAEALQYYNDYFDDAGVESEKEVIDALGNPAKVAENIKRDLYGDEVMQSSVKHPPMGYQETSNTQQKKEKKNVEGGLFAHIGAWYENLPDWGQIVAIIALVLLSPVILGAASGIVGALFGIACGWFSLILGFGVAALALLAILVALVIIGIMCVAEAPFGALALVGAGLLCGGIGLLFLMLTVVRAGIATPAIFRGIVSLCRKIFGQKEVAA